MLTDISPEVLDIWIDEYGMAMKKFAGDEIRVIKLAVQANPAKEPYIEQIKNGYQLRVFHKIVKGVGPDDPTGISPPWFERDATDVQFPAFLNALRAEGWDEESLQSLDDSCLELINLIDPPAHPDVDTRGMTVGYVQSGKTASYTGLIATAADAGYRFFIVLAGVHNNLRNQTQRRLEKHLIETGTGWHAVTGDTEDVVFDNATFHEYFAEKVPPNIVLAVVKKNSHVLRKLIATLNKRLPEMERRGIPTLVIDDEADQASINTNKEAEERTKINQLILDVFETMPRSAYVAYTATPFANVLIDSKPAKDLYPRHFIRSLPQPPAYFGAERLFGRSALDDDDPEIASDGMDSIRIIPDEELAMLKPPNGKAARLAHEPDMAPSLAASIDWFVVATAARWTRNDGPVHTSMLVHTSVFRDAHAKLRSLVRGYLSDLRAELEAGTLAGRLIELWHAESERVPASMFDPAPAAVSDDEIVAQIADVVEAIVAVEDNSTSEERLFYDEANPRPIIAIGGNTLSRGLTLEGLVVSYFLRTASTYDTLLQAGRWFGYRFGYEDLPRIWMTAALVDDFRHLALVEEEIRRDIARYGEEGRTPSEVAVRIRQHPTLAVTAATKRRTMITSKLSYSDTSRQTIFLDRTDENVIKRNFELGIQLVTQLDDRGLVPESPRPGSFVYRDVQSRSIVEFLERYAFYGLLPDLTSRLLLDYIAAENERGGLHSWSVGVVGKHNAENTRQLGPLGDVGLLTRTRLRHEDPNVAYIKALVGSRDRVLDVPSQFIPKGKYSEFSLRRSYHLDERGLDHVPGLLLLAPVDRRSTPTAAQLKVKPESRSRRYALDAPADPMGIALVFPRSLDETNAGVSYVQNDLSRIASSDEEIELYDESDVDEIQQPGEEQDNDDQ
jgi:hypothetical protein